MNQVETNVCFLISPIGERDTPTRLLSDNVRDYVVKPALGQLGLPVKRADELARPGHVTHHIIDLLRVAPLVVADLSGRNANVYYELGVRHCYDRPALLIAQHGEELPADLVHQRVVFYDTSDPRVLQTAVDELRAMALTALAGDAVGPVAVATATSTLSGGSASETALAEIMTTIGELRGELGTSIDRLTDRQRRVIAELVEAIRQGLSYLASEKDLPRDARHTLGELVLMSRVVVDEFGDPESRRRVVRLLRQAGEIYGA